MAVSLVLVSHSHELVHGLKKLLEQVQPDVAIAVAGGTDENDIGTSALKIKDAIESVYSEDGVALLFDLGSARLNAEMAVEMLDGNANVTICDAPLVEGAYAAVVQAGIGGSLDEVADAASQAKTFSKLS